MQRVYLDLNESQYRYDYEGITFYFSSKFNETRFLKGVDDFIKMESLKLSNRYKIKCNFNLFLGLSYYKKIEKRGFRVETDSGKINPNELIIAKLNS